MRNKLTDLQNHLFGLMEKLNDDDLTGEQLEMEIKRTEAFSSLATVAVKNASLMVKCAEIYGLPSMGGLPLLPESPESIPKISRKESLLRRIEKKENE